METQAVVDYMCGAIIKTYKIDQDELRSLVCRELEREKKLAAVIETAGDIRFVIRTREYKDFFVKVKKKVYHDLRAYKKAPVETGPFTEGPFSPASDAAVRLELIQNHVSTRERLADRDFYRQLFALMGPVRTLVDVGCGMNPLMIPDEAVEESITALDKDKESIRLLSDYCAWSGNEKIKPQLWDIAQGWEGIVPKDGPFDLALLMKIVPVVNRQQRELLDILAQVPARRVLITGSKNSMTKNISIFRRERAVVESFILRGGLVKEDFIDTQEEFGWIVRSSHGD